MTARKPPKAIRALRQEWGAVRWGVIGVPVVILAMVGLAALLLPPSYSTDLSRIGQGKPAVVQVYDADNLVSHRLTEGFNAIRDEFEDQVEFLLADLNAPAGDAFARRHGAASGTVIFFNGEGRRLHTLQGIQEPATLRQGIIQALEPGGQ